jgi:ribosome-interacting GTPase 1
MVREYGIVNADVVVREDATADQVVDVLAGNRVYVPAVVALNKIDSQTRRLVDDAVKMFNSRGFPVVPVSAQKGIGIEKLKDHLYDSLKFINVFLKPQGGEADLKEPLVLTTGSTVGDVCDHLHRDFRRRFRYALVSGASAKFANQVVGIDHKLADGDILTVVVRRS